MMMMIARAAYHQAHPRFKGAGSQCVTNSYAAIQKARKMDMKSWTETDLNEILNEGDSIYQTMKTSGLSHNFLLISDMQKFDNNICIENTEFGSIFTIKNVPPYQNLFNSLLKIDNFAFLTISCYTIAVIHDDDNFYVFDSHSRNELGLVSENGTAVLTSHSSVSELYTFLLKLAKGLSNQENNLPFELSIISFALESDFEGFSEISEGEYSCRLQILQEILENDDSLECSSSEEEFLAKEPSSIEGDFPTFTDSSIRSRDGSTYRFTPLYKNIQIAKDILTDRERNVITDRDTSTDYINGAQTEIDRDVPKEKDTLLDRDDPTLRDFQTNTKTEFATANDVLTERDSSPDRNVLADRDGLFETVASTVKAAPIDKDTLRNIDILTNIDTLVEGDAQIARDVQTDRETLTDIDIDKSDIDNLTNRDTLVNKEAPLVSDALSDSDACTDRDVPTNRDTWTDINTMTNIDTLEERDTPTEIDAQTDKHIPTERDPQTETNTQTDSDALSVMDENGPSDSLLDDVSEIFNLNDSNTLLHSIDLNDFEIEDSDNTINYFSEESDYENIPLSFIAKKNKRYKKTVLTDKEVTSNIESNTAHNSEERVQRVERGRKRGRHEDEWKRNIAKRRRNEGKSYINKHGQRMRERNIKTGCRLGCKFKCQQNFNRNGRNDIFHSYWKLGETLRQRQFILKFTLKTQKRRGKNKADSRRENSVKYFLPNIESKSTIRVCKKFFLDTLDISQKIIQTAHLNIDIQSVAGRERRGVKPGCRSNKVSPDLLDGVRQHIEKFPAVSSHYCRKDSNRQYLDGSLNLKKMYELYCDHCKTKNQQMVKIHTYRKLFNTEYNLSFYTPIKDQCDTCLSFQNATTAEKENMSTSHAAHILNKEKAYENKKNDKKQAKEDSSITVACFDLEEVLITPKAFASKFYYKRRLNTYNFTIYNLGNADGYAYIWNESIASRGANEIASCVFDFIKKKSESGCKKFIFYSDNCFSQNKNKFYLSMLWYALNKFDIECIEHKYLEKGHTFNENDSVHAAVEHASKHLTIYTTAQWASVIQSARRNNPYSVKEMSLQDFFNFKAVADILKNFDLTEAREKVGISKIRHLRFNIENENKYVFKYQYNDVEFSVVNLVTRVRRSVDQIPHAKDIMLMQQSKEPIPISLEKYNDLLSLCLADLIPRPHHLFFALLPHSGISE